MQIFVTGLGAQAERFQVPIELVIVDWNPPAEKPLLADAIDWPGTDWVESRVVEVPAELHRRYKHADSLPLYQMIAKNVGIRRSRGEFVLATNIDLLFSDELFEFLAARRLETGKMYRVDRWDSAEDVPLNATIQEQLQYCATHLLRVNARGETYAVTPEGKPIAGANDVTADVTANVTANVTAEDDPAPEEEPATSDAPTPASANVSQAKPEPPRVAPKRDSVTLLWGFYSLESGSGESFRWSRPGVGLEVSANGPNRELRLDIDPTPALGPAALRIRAGDLEATTTIERRSLLYIRSDFQANAGVPVHIEITNRASRKPLAVDPRDLGFRVYSARCALAPAEAGHGIEVTAKLQPGTLQRLAWFWGLWRSGTPGMRLTIPMPAFLMTGLQPRLEETGLSIAITRPEAVRAGPAPGDGNQENTEPEAEVPEDAEEEDDASDPAPESSSQDSSESSSNVADYLHTNSCGDFTLLSLEDWLDLRGYPEWDMYSMNIDSALCISAARAGIEEVFLTARVYHIEHAAGSGFTPEGQQKLWDRLREKGIDWVEFDEISAIDRQVGRLGSTMIFNRNDWGLIHHNLPERLVGAQSVDSGTTDQSEYSKYVK